MRALIFLILAVSSSCATKAPLPPRVDLYQPILSLNRCNVYRMNNDEVWEIVDRLPLEACNGVFGVTADDFNKLRDYSRRLKSFISNNCNCPQVQP